jgi:hypothetical protein
MGIGKRRINSAVRVLLIVLVAELEIDPVLAEPEHVQVEVELEHDPVVAAALVLQVVAELELVQVVVELEHDPVVAELELAQVVAEPERDPVVAEPELAPVVEVLAPNPLRAQLAVALKIKSVTAAHRRDLPLLAAEDLVAGAAETTREPVAAEAVIAWEVAE